MCTCKINEELDGPGSATLAHLEYCKEVGRGDSRTRVICPYIGIHVGTADLVINPSRERILLMSGDIIGLHDYDLTGGQVSPAEHLIHATHRRLQGSQRRHHRVVSSVYMPLCPL